VVGRMGKKAFEMLDAAITLEKEQKLEEGSITKPESN